MNLLPIQQAFESGHIYGFSFTTGLLTFACSPNLPCADCPIQLSDDKDPSSILCSSHSLNSPLVTSLQAQYPELFL